MKTLYVLLGYSTHNQQLNWYEDCKRTASSPSEKDDIQRFTNSDMILNCSHSIFEKLDNDYFEEVGNDTYFTSNKVKSDALNPAHYNKGIQPIEFMKQGALNNEEFEGFCKGNILKYVSRERDKNGIEDLEKAKVYLDWLLAKRRG